MNTHYCKAVIIDDEPDARKMISIFLRELFPNIEVVAQLGSIKESIIALPSLQPDILFLDIEMPGGSGFDILSQLPFHKGLVIFVTAYSHYAIPAIKASAHDYILKPIDKEEFEGAVNRALKKLVRQDIEDKILERVLNPKGTKKIGVPASNGLKFVETDTLLYCEADDNYTTLFFTDNSKTVVSKSLSYFEAEMKPLGFLRIHHKYLVNSAHVVAFTKEKNGGMVTLTGQKQLKVSQNRKSDLLKSFTQIQ